MKLRLIVACLVFAVHLLAVSASVAAISFGIGYSDVSQPGKAGEAAAAAAKNALEEVPPKLVLVFDRLQGDMKAKRALLAGVARHFDKTLIHGCTARSPLTTETNDCTAAVLALAGEIDVQSAVATVANGHESCGREIARQLKTGEAAEGTSLLIVMGSCTVPKNSQLAQGLKSAMGDGVHLVGGAASGQGFVYHRGEVHAASNAGLLLSGDFRLLFASATAPERTPETVISAAAKAAGDVHSKAPADAKLALVFNCAGRFMELKSRHAEELAALRKGLRTRELFGYYGNGEIGPRPGQSESEGLAHHVVICLISPP
jgi:hypothetical protein